MDRMHCVGGFESVRRRVLKVLKACCAAMLTTVCGSEKDQEKTKEKGGREGGRGVKLIPDKATPSKIISCL